MRVQAQSVGEVVPRTLPLDLFRSLLMRMKLSSRQIARAIDSRAPLTCHPKDRRAAGLGFDLPFAARSAAPGQAVIVTRLPPGDDDMVAHLMAGHATGVEHAEYRGGA